MHVAAAVVFEAVAVVVDIGVEADVEEAGGAIGEVEAAAVAPGGAHVVGHGEVDPAVEELVELRFGEGAYLVGGEAAVEVDADVAEALEVLGPSGLGVVGIAVGEAGGVAGGVGVFAVGAEAGEVLVGGVFHAEGVVELEVVHVGGAVGEVDGGAELEVGEGAVVGELGHGGSVLIIGVFHLDAEA